MIVVPWIVIRVDDARYSPSYLRHLSHAGHMERDCNTLAPDRPEHGEPSG